jgi:hypothetical protein
LNIIYQPNVTVKCGDIRGRRRFSVLQKRDYYIFFLATKNTKLALLVNMVAYQEIEGLTAGKNLHLSHTRANLL